MGKNKADDVIATGELKDVEEFAPGKNKAGEAGATCEYNDIVEDAPGNNIAGESDATDKLVRPEEILAAL